MRYLTYFLSLDFGREFNYFRTKSFCIGIAVQVLLENFGFSARELHIVAETAFYSFEEGIYQYKIFVLSLSLNSLWFMLAGDTNFCLVFKVKSNLSKPCWDMCYVFILPASCFFFPVPPPLFNVYPTPPAFYIIIFLPLLFLLYCLFDMTFVTLSFEAKVRCLHL